MKICVYVTSLDKTGGIESHLVQFIQNLSEAGHQLVLVCGDCKINLGWRDQLGKNCKLWVQTINNPLLRLTWLILTGFRARIAKFDAVYSNGAGSSIYMFVKIGGFNSWTHHHHMSADESDRETWSRLYTATLKSCNTLVACARINANRLSENLYRNVEVVYCFSRCVSRMPHKGGIQNSFNFGYFGRLIPAKGLPVILKLSEDPNLAEIDWHIWGEGGDFDVGSFDRSPRTHFHGAFASQEELIKVLNSLDAFTLFSTFREGLPICLIEATGAGLPWIATNQGGVSEVAELRDEFILLSSCPTYEECASACKEMLEAIKGRRINHEEITEIYEEKFSKEILTKQWERLIQMSQVL